MADDVAGGVHGDEAQPAVGPLGPDPVDDLGLLGPGERGQLDVADAGFVAWRLEAYRDNERRRGRGGRDVDVVGHWAAGTRIMGREWVSRPRP